MAAVGDAVSMRGGFSAVQLVCYNAGRSGMSRVAQREVPTIPRLD